MPSDLTAADMAEHAVTFTTGSGKTEIRVFVAAYVAADDAKMPGMLVFKDHQHRIIAMVNAATVLTVERLDRGENVPPASPSGGVNPNSGGVTLTKLPIPGAAGMPSTVYIPPETWSTNL